MNGYAKITITLEAIYVRFEGIGNRAKFNEIMRRFNQSFQLKEWHEKRRAWELPHSDLDVFVSFCAGIFGPNGYVIEKSISQTELPVNMDTIGER